MTGTNTPMRVHYEGLYQVAEYENRRQAYTVWTISAPQRVCYFANTLEEARQYTQRHAAMAGLLRPSVEVMA